MSQPTIDMDPILHEPQIARRVSGPFAGVAIGAASLLVFVSLDLLTHQAVPFSAFYVLPTALVAWIGGRSTGLVFALLSAAVAGALALREPSTTSIQLGLGLAELSVGVVTALVVSRLRHAVEALGRLAGTDALTGVVNTRAFYERLELEATRARRSGRPLTLAYLDLDNFKSVNDRLGHLAGDELLRDLADLLRSNSRASDLCARLGGDEFALLLPETDARSAEVYFNRLRGELRGHFRAHSEWKVGASIGAVTFEALPDDNREILRKADLLLYEAKRTGKDRTCHQVVSA